MTAAEEKREQAIQDIANMMRTNRVTFEIVVRKKPKGIKVIYEVTEEQMNKMISKASIKKID